MSVGDIQFKNRWIFGYTRPDLVKLLCNLSFIGFIGVTLMTSAIGDSTIISNNLEPGEMSIYESNLYEQITITGETIATHFFNSRPQIVGSIDYSFSDSTVIASSDFVFWEDYFSKGSIVTISWTSDNEVDFYIVIGEDNFDKWKEGQTTQFAVTSGTSGIFPYILTSDDHVYFAFENISFNSKTVQVEFQFVVPLFDIASAEKSITGSFSGEDINHNFIVIENTGLSSVDYTLELFNSTSSDNSDKGDSDDGRGLPIPVSFSSIFLAIFVLSLSMRKFKRN